MNFTWTNNADKETPDKESTEESSESLKSELMQQLEGSMDSMRSMALYGDINEEKASEIVGGLLALHHMGKSVVEQDAKAIEMFVSTYGGFWYKRGKIYR